MAKTDLSIKGILTKISVLFIFLMNVEASLTNVALADIAKAFPTVATTTISLITTLPTLISVIVAMFLLPNLVRMFDKKKIIIWSLIIYMVGGIGGGIFCATIFQLLLCRVILGFGMGLSAPLCAAIISELYDGMERTNMLGWSNGVSSVITMILTMLAGVLCAVKWQYTFYSYTVFILILLLEIFFLPSMPVPKRKDASGAEQKVKASYTGRQGVKLVLVCAYIFANVTCTIAVLIKAAMFIVSNQLGDPIAIAGVLTVAGIGNLSASFLFGVIEKFAKRYVLVLAPLLLGVGAFMMCQSTSLGFFTFSAFVFQFGQGLGQPACTNKAVRIGPKMNGAFASSMVIGFIGIGVFTSTYFENLVALFMTPTPANVIGFVSAACIALAVITLIYVAWDPLQGANEERKPDFQEVL